MPFPGSYALSGPAEPVRTYRSRLVAETARPWGRRHLACMPARPMRARALHAVNLPGGVVDSIVLPGAIDDAVGHVREVAAPHHHASRDQAVVRQLPDLQASEHQRLAGLPARSA